MIYTDPFKNPELQDKAPSLTDMLAHLIGKEASIIIEEMEGKTVMRPKPNQGEIMWQAAGQPAVPISMLKTRHLYFTLRLVYNNLVVPKYRYQFDNKRILRFPSTEEGKRVLAGMFEEIGKRDNLTDAQLQGLTHMAEVVRLHL